jgi:hypothetical protein
MQSRWKALRSLRASSSTVSLQLWLTEGASTTSPRIDWTRWLGEKTHFEFKGNKNTQTEALYFLRSKHRCSFYKDGLRTSHAAV